MRIFIYALVVWHLLSGPTGVCRAERISSFIDGHTCFFQYFGAWQSNSTGRYTIYPGSQVRFRLKGNAHLVAGSGLPGMIRVKVRRDESVVWDGLLGRGGIDIDGGTTSALFSIIYVAAGKKGFDPVLPDAQGAVFGFHGIELDARSVLHDPPQPTNHSMLDFIGDSITAGVVILGRSGTWAEHSDASLTYAFQLAERIGARYRIRSFPGGKSDDISGRCAFFRKGIPLSINEQPDIVFINIGANDRAKKNDHYRTKMRAILNVTFSVYPTTKIVLLNFFRMTPDRMPVLEELARSYPDGRVMCFDTRPYLMGYSDRGVHPDVASHRKLADALVPYVDQLLLRDSSGSRPKIEPIGILRCDR